MKKTLFLSCVLFGLNLFAESFIVESKVKGRKDFKMSYTVQSEKRWPLYMKTEIDTILAQLVEKNKNPEKVKSSFEDRFPEVSILNLKIENN